MQKPIARIGTDDRATSGHEGRENFAIDTVAIHATLMVAAWSILMPAGGIVARYFKVTRGQDFPRVVENLFWWRWHRALQYCGMLMSTVALAAIMSETGGQFDTLHGQCGIGVMILGWLQIVSALLRGSKGGPTDKQADPRDPSTWRGDHYDMTARRRSFEAWHKPLGWLVIVLAAITVLLGTQLAASPPWVLLVIGILQAGFLAGLIDGIVRRRWIGTYASLWGFGVGDHPNSTNLFDFVQNRRPTRDSLSERSDLNRQEF